MNANPTSNTSVTPVASAHGELGGIIDYLQPTSSAAAMLAEGVLSNPSINKSAFNTGMQNLQIAAQSATEADMVQNAMDTEEQMASARAELAKTGSMLETALRTMAQLKSMIPDEVDENYVGKLSKLNEISVQIQQTSNCIAALVRSAAQSAAAETSDNQRR